MEDEEIRAALRRGQLDRAFELFRRAHGPAAYTKCLRITRDPRTAEDAMQEAMITAFRHVDKLLEVTSLRGWLMTIAARKAIDAQRSLRRASRVHDAATEPDSEHDDRDVVAQLASSAEQRALEECLGALAPEVRAAILLRFGEELSWEEIAQILDLPLDTIRMRVQRKALKLLKACLESKNVTL